MKYLKHKLNEYKEQDLKHKLNEYKEQDFQINTFNLRTEVHYILKGNKKQRKEKLNFVREKLKEQYIDISKILKGFEEITLENPNITIENYLNKITFSENISPKVVKEIINGFKTYFKDKKESINRFNRYKNNKILLIKELYNSDYIPKGNINISVYGGCLLVEFENKKDYHNIFNDLSIGRFNPSLNLISIKGINKNNILKHEYQHYINSKYIKKIHLENIGEKGESILRKLENYFLKEKNDLIKNELIARYIEDFNEFFTLIEVLGNTSLYLYNKENKEKQVIYGINLMNEIKTLKKEYPDIYLYLTLILKDNHKKYFLNLNKENYLNIIKIKLNIWNILISKEFIIILHLIYFYIIINK